MQAYGSYNTAHTPVTTSGTLSSTYLVMPTSVAASSGAAAFRRLSSKPEKMPTPHVTFVGSTGSPKEARRKERVQKHMMRVQKHLAHGGKLRHSQKKELIHSLRVLGEIAGKHGFTLEYALNDTFAAFAHTVQENIGSVLAQLKTSADKDMLQTLAAHFQPNRIIDAAEDALKDLRKELENASDDEKGEIETQIKDLQARLTQFRAVGKLRDHIGGLATALDEDIREEKQPSATKKDAILGIAKELHDMPSDDVKALEKLRKIFDEELTDAGIPKDDNAARTRGALTALEKFLALAESAENKYIEGGLALHDKPMRTALRFKPEELTRLKGLAAGELDRAGIKKAAETAKADLIELHAARGESGYERVAPGTPGHRGAVGRLIRTLEALSDADNPKELVTKLEDQQDVGKQLFAGIEKDQALKEARAAAYLNQLLDLYTVKRREAVKAYSEINQISALSMSSSLQARRQALTESVKVFSPFTPEKMAALRERIAA